MRRAIYLDFSTPIFESDADLAGFFSKLSEISRLLHKSKNLKFYISFSIDFVSLAKKHNSELVHVIKELLENERVEFVVKDNFHVCSGLLGKDVFEFNNILNEYLIGYLFGSDKDFEGDSSIMIKNLVNYFPTKGVYTQELVSDCSEMGYKTLLVDSKYLLEGSFISSGTTFAALDMGFADIFSDFITKESIDSYINKNLSRNFEIYYLNLFDCYMTNKEEFSINVANAFHLMDLTDLIEYRLVDESFDMSINKSQEALETLSNKELEKLLYKHSNLLEIQKELSKVVNFSTVNNMTEYEEYKTIPLWETSSSEEINSYLKFNYIVLTLLSRSVDAKIDLLDNSLKTQISMFLDELQSYSKDNHSLKEVISKYHSFINQK